LSVAASARSGLEQLRAVFDATYPDREPGIGATMGFSMVELEEGRVVFGAIPTSGSQSHRTVHGGYAATLLDSAVAARSIPG